MIGKKSAFGLIAAACAICKIAVTPVVAATICEDLAGSNAEKTYSVKFGTSAAASVNFSGSYVSHKRSDKFPDHETPFGYHHNIRVEKQVAHVLIHYIFDSACGDSKDGTPGPSGNAVLVLSLVSPTTSTCPAGTKTEQWEFADAGGGKFTVTDTALVAACAAVGGLSGTATPN